VSSAPATAVELTTSVGLTTTEVVGLLVGVVVTVGVTVGVEVDFVGVGVGGHVGVGDFVCSV
jgi:hypothetical protein